MYNSQSEAKMHYTQPVKSAGAARLGRGSDGGGALPAPIDARGADELHARPLFFFLIRQCMYNSQVRPD